MRTSATFRMADRLADGNLVAAIQAGRSTGLSFDAISRQLHVAYGIEVSGTTVASWSRMIDEHTAEVAS